MASVLIRIAVLAALCALTDGKGGSSSYGGRGSTTGAYAASRGSRYAMYPAAGVLVYWGMSRRYRSHGYRDKQYSSNQQANQAQPYRYLNLTFVFPGTIAKVSELRFTDSTGALITTTPTVTASSAGGSTAALFDGDISTSYDFGTTGAEVYLILDFGTAYTFGEYEIAPVTNDASFVNWELSGSNSAAGPWSALDSYGKLSLTTQPLAESYAASQSDYNMAVSEEFIVTALGTSAGCPASYDEVTAITYNAQGPAASRAGADSISPYECATSCDEKGLACSAFRLTYESGSTTCHLHTTDEESGETRKEEKFLGSKKCAKAGLMNCTQSVCPAVVSRRLMSIESVLASSLPHEHKEQPRSSSVLPAGTAVLFGEALAEEHRRLAVPNASTVCSTCPTFKYDEQEDKAGAIVGAIFGVLIVVGLICCICQKKKAAQNNQTHQAPPLHNFNQPPASNFTSVMPQAPQQQMVQVTVPPGVVPGQTIAVQSSVGVVQATVPAGAFPGTTFLISVGGPVQPQYAFGGKALT